MGKTHDYTRRCCGHDFTILHIAEGGDKLRVVGWGMGLRKGDYVLLPNKTQSTRYRIDSISYQADPADMWLAFLSFAARENAGKPQTQGEAG
jgi:hypothetical protein